MATETKKTNNLTAPVYNTEGKKVRDVTLAGELFDVDWNPDLVHQVVQAMRSNARANTAHTKDRSEVSGGGKKPWRQKGTGRARHGSTRSPIWRTGGVAFGPRNERNYARKTTKKMRTKAFLSVLSQKFRDGEVLFVDSLTFAEPKTREADALLATLAKSADLPKLADKQRNAALIAIDTNDLATKRSFANIARADVEEARNLNPLDLLSYTYIVVTNPDEVIAQLTERTK